jgi:hypothetical protein
VTAPVRAALDGKRGAAAVAVAAAAVFALESLAWPLSPGRDATTYLEYYADMWHAHPTYPFLMLFRTPLAPVFYGSLLQLGGLWLAEVGAGALYAATVVLIAAAARTYGWTAGAVTAGALLLFPPLGALFHQYSSDPVAAFTVALWAWTAVRAFAAPTPGRWAVSGIAVWVMVLARPGFQVLLVFAFVALLAAAPWRRRWACVVAYAGSAGVLLVAWASYNDLRYGDFTVARGASVGTPFYRMFVMEKNVRPTNGPASGELAAAVQRDLLDKQPYLREHMTVDRFFTVGSDREWGDLVVLSDRDWGWSSNYVILRRAGVEAVKKHPKLYISDVAQSVWYELAHPYRWVAPTVGGAAPAATAASGQSVSQAQSNDPGGNRWWLSSTSSGQPPTAAAVDRLNRRLYSLVPKAQNRNGMRGLANVLNDIARWYPPVWLWLIVGALAACVARRRRIIVLAALAAAGILVLAVTLLGYGPALEYGLAFDPVFVLFTVTSVVVAVERYTTRAVSVALP